jgi:hypothetical protein
MSGDDFERAIAALREQGDNPAPQARLTKERILRELRPRARRRRAVWFIPLAALLAGSTVLAATGRLPDAYHAAAKTVSAQGQPDVAPSVAPALPGVLVVDVDPGAGGLDAGALRDAIAREAAVRVTDVANASGPRLVVRGDGARGLTFRLLGTGDHDVERSIVLPEGSESKQLSIAGLVAASLMEDDAAELLARLRAEAKKVEPPPPPPARVEAPRPQPSRRELPPCMAASRELYRVIGADVAPFAGTSAFEPPGTVRRFSIELFGGGASGVAGIEFSPLVTFNRGFVCGLQLAGLGNWTSGHVRGVAFSGGIGWADSVDGVQQNGLLSVTTHRLRGVQLSPINMANEVQGAQLGMANIAGDVQGVQVGMVNVARTSDASVGVVSIVTSGRTNLQAFATTNAVTSIAVQHGSRIVHNFYGGSFAAGGKSGVAFGPLFGLGFHAHEDARLFLDFDFLVHLLFGSSGSKNPQSLWEVRAVAGLRLSSAFAIYAGPAFDVLMTHTGQQARALDGTVYEKTFTTNDGTLHLSPALVAGVRGL